MAKNITVCLTFDFDAISLWIGTFHTSSPSAISRGEFGRVGTERLLKHLKEWEVRSTWFVPGHTADTWPDLARRIAAEGHEIAHHGYCHENVGRLKPDDEARVIDLGSDALRRITGADPIGFRTPGGDLSPNSLRLLRERGFVYDSSMMGDDFTPYYCRIGDHGALDQPYVFGQQIDLVEIPFSWALDDFPHFEYLSTSRGTAPGLSSAEKVYEIWSAEFDYLHDHIGMGTYCLTMHPQCIGRAHRLLMLDRLVKHFKAHDGVVFKTMAEVAREFKAGHPLKSRV